MSIQNLLINDTNKKNINIFVNDCAVAGDLTITGKLTIDDIELQNSTISTIANDLVLNSGTDDLIIGDSSISRNLDTSLLRIKGGTKGGSNSELKLFGENHATLANQTHIKGDPISFRNLADVEIAQFDTNSGSVLFVDFVDELSADHGVVIETVLIKDFSILQSGLAFVPENIADTPLSASVSVTTTTYSTTTSTGNYTSGLGDGVVGFIKKFGMVRKVGTDIYNLTPTNALGFTTIQFVNVGDGCTLQFMTDGVASGWIILGSNGVVII